MPAISHSRMSLTALVALLLLALGLLTAPPSAAHDVLVEAEPGEDAVLQDSPGQIVLTFNNELLDVSPAIVVSDVDGQVVAEDGVTVQGRSVVQELPPSLDDGQYQVEWSVVSSDGHRIDGNYVFTVEGTEEADAPATADDGPTDEPPVAEGLAAEEEAPQTEPTADTDSFVADDGGLPAWAGWVIGVVVIAALGAGIMFGMRRGRHKP